MAMEGEEEEPYSPEGGPRRDRKAIYKRYVHMSAGTPPPPPSNPGTVPIDDYIGMLIIIGAFAGFLVVLLLKKYRVNNLDEI